MSLTPTQQARFDRILAVAAQLASDGGFDAVQMREVASSADVALGTLYRYFPSKEHLLVSVMLRQIEGLSDRLQTKPPSGVDACERVSDVLRRANLSLQRQPKFTAALVKSLVSGDQSVAPVVRDVREAMGAIIVSAMHPDADSERDLLVAQVIDEVWFASLVAWISGAEPAASIERKLGAAIELLLRPAEVTS